MIHSLSVLSQKVESKRIKLQNQLCTSVVRHLKCDLSIEIVKN